MLVRLILAALCVAFAGVAGAQSVLNAGTHADGVIAPAITATVGGGVVDASVFVDYDSSTVISTVLRDAHLGSGTLFSVASGHSVNHAPYGVVNASYCCAAGGRYDDANYYTTLVGSSLMLALPLAVKVGGNPPAGTAPPTANVSVTSQNSSNGGTGWGLDFALSTSYLGLDTTTDSNASAEFAGLFAALKFKHPTWTWFDVKGALRQTASNWSTGWSATGFGYGFVNWNSANAISSTSSLYLEPPGLTVNNFNYYAILTLYPFRQTRRSYEVVYSVSSSYVWPVKNEYTTTDITNSGATLLCSTSGNSATTPTCTFTPAVAGSVTFVAFTTDGSGNYSRVEAFSEQTVSFVLSAFCPL